MNGISSFSSPIDWIRKTPELSFEQFELVKTIGEIAARILFVVASAFLALILTPLAIKAAVVLLTAIGASFLAAFFWSRDPFYFRPLLKPLPPLLDPIPEPVVETRPLSLPPPERAPRGYVNHGNNDWLNADLQLLDTDPMIRRWVREAIPEPESGDNPFSSAHSAFRDFFLESDSALAHDRAVSLGSSEKLRLALSRVSFHIEAPENPIFNHQEDAREGISPLLERLPDKLKISVQEKIYYDTANLPPISGNSEGTSTRETKSWDIVLPIKQEDVSLEGALRRFCERGETDFKTRELRGEDGSLHRYPIARVERKWEAPYMLRLTLKRFLCIKPWMAHVSILQDIFAHSAGRIVKQEASIAIPLHLTHDGEDYRLVAFNCHKGHSPASGHYTSYSCRGEQWYWENDSFVIPVDRERIDEVLRSPDPYMIWYARADRSSARLPA